VVGGCNEDHNTASVVNAVQPADPTASGRVAATVEQGTGEGAIVVDGAEFGGGVVAAAVAVRAASHDGLAGVVADD
jgi:hypothetical protein